MINLFPTENEKKKKKEAWKPLFKKGAKKYLCSRYFLEYERVVWTFSLNNLFVERYLCILDPYPLYLHTLIHQCNIYFSTLPLKFNWFDPTVICFQFSST